MVGIISSEENYYDLKPRLQIVSDSSIAETTWRTCLYNRGLMPAFAPHIPLVTDDVLVGKIDAA